MNSIHPLFKNNSQHILFKNYNSSYKSILNKIIKQSSSSIDDYDLSISNIQSIFSYPKNTPNLFLFIIVYNNKLYTLYPHTDSRKKIITSVVMNILKKLLLKYSVLPNMFIPFYISDTHFYKNNDLPFFVEARPKNEKGILYPDQNFYNIFMNNNFINYDEFKNILKTHKCNSISKQNIIYFRGANTGSDKHNMRMKLKNIVQEKKNNSIQIHIKEEYVPMYEFCKYKYLLNLPGHQPWSYRFSKILPMNSLVFHINVLQSYDNGKTYNKKWIQCFDEIFVPNKDYIEIDYKWIENKTNDSNIIQVYNDLVSLFNYYEKNHSLYTKIIKSASKKSNLITNQLCDDVFTYLILYFTKSFYLKNKSSNIDSFLESLLKNTPKNEILEFNLKNKNSLINKNLLSSSKKEIKKNYSSISKL